MYKSLLHDHNRSDAKRINFPFHFSSIWEKPGKAGLFL